MIHLKKFNPYMKHIKLFEGYLDEPEWKEITKQEYQDIIQNYNDISEPFNLKEFNWINNNFKNTNWYPGNWTNIRGMGNIELKSVIITNHFYSGPNEKQLSIYKLRDDWFIVSYKEKWYKCDKLDGLIKFIEKIKDENYS